MVIPLLLAMGVILPEVALEPVDAAQRGHVEQIAPGPCGADSAMQLLIEGEGPRRIGRQLDLATYRGKRIEVSSRIVARGTEVVPSLNVEVRAGTPGRPVAVFVVKPRRGCEALSVQLEVPALATEVEVFGELASTGLLLVEPIKVRELGPATQFDWSKVAWRGTMGDWAYNEGFIRSPNKALSFTVQPDGAWVAPRGRVTPLEGGRWHLELDGQAGDFAPSSASGVLRIEGVWNGEPVRIALNPATLEIITGTNRRFFASTHRPMRKGCFFFHRQFDIDRTTCGLLARDAQFPQTLVVLIGDLVR